MDLKDKTILVTGASQGIGKETALLLAQKGAKVIVTYNSNKEKAEQVANDCNKHTQKHTATTIKKLDITNQDSLPTFFKEIIEEHKKIDILINNAGVVFWKEIEKNNVADINKEINTNLTGPILLTKLFLTQPQLTEQKENQTNEAVIVNISSVAGMIPLRGTPVYNATKYGLRGFTQSVALSLPKNIRIYCVNPGLTSTQMTNFQGVHPKEVADIIVKTAEESLGKSSGGDVNIDEYL